MNTPIYDFVTDYIDSDTSRLHMPGHKGAGRLGIEERDITEIRGADELYEASGIIAESEKNAASLFGTGATYYSTEGSSHVIKTMLLLSLFRWRSRRSAGADGVTAAASCGEAGTAFSASKARQVPGRAAERPVILAARNVHKSFIFGCALLDLDVSWIFPDAEDLSSICSCHPEAGKVCSALEKMLQEGTVPAAVYITSPDYLGFTADISAISAGIRRVCLAAGLPEDEVPLLVDNAHGAYLHFLPESLHPMDLGAYLCSDSAHKTLPVLTGGAYLQMSKAAAKELSGEVRAALSVFGSTSPSYVIMQSLDLANKYLADGYRERLSETVRRIEALKKRITEAWSGLKEGPVVPTEPLKLVINAAAFGLSGTELGDRLRQFQIEPEFTDVHYVVLMFTPETPERDYRRIEEALSDALLNIRLNPPEGRSGSFLPGADSRTGIPASEGGQKPESHETAGALHLKPLKRVMSIREAVFSPHETIPVTEAAGRICGQTTVSCPPAIPIAVSGERITGDILPLFLAYGIEELSVIR